MSTPTNVAVTASHRTIDDHIVRTIGIFQALVALPTAVFLGIWTFIQLIDPYENFSNAYYYYFLYLHHLFTRV
jgi:hypothetical protein